MCTEYLNDERGMKSEYVSLPKFSLEVCGSQVSIKYEDVKTRPVHLPIREDFLARAV